MLKVDQCISLLVSEVASGEVWATESQEGLDRGCAGENNMKSVTKARA